MALRPTQIERAFALAATGTYSSINEIRGALRAEGFPHDGQFTRRMLHRQLSRVMAEARGEVASTTPMVAAR